MARRFTVEITEVFPGTSSRPTVCTVISGRSIKSVMCRAFDEHRHARGEVEDWPFMLRVWATKDGKFLFGRENNERDLRCIAGVMPF